MPNAINIVGVGDVYAYSGNELVFKSITMINTTVETSTSSSEISGGKRNKLQNIYYHSGRLNVTLEDTQWNMEWVKRNTGGQNISWTTLYGENITISGAGVGTLTKTAVALNGQSEVKVAIQKEDGTILNATVTGGNTFTITDSSLFNTNVCVKYNIIDPNTSSVTIPASIIPERLNVIINVDLAGNTSGEGIIGYAEFNIPSLQLSGAQTINMTSDGYSSVPLSGMALAFTPTGQVNACANEQVYAVVTTKIFNTNWYDNVIALAISGGDFSLPKDSTKQLEIFGIKGDGTAIPVIPSALTYTSGTDTNASVSTSGLVTGLLAGTSLITAKITGKETIEASCTVTVTV